MRLHIAHGPVTKAQQSKQAKKNSPRILGAIRRLALSHELRGTSQRANSNNTSFEFEYIKLERGGLSPNVPK